MEAMLAQVMQQSTVRRQQTQVLREAQQLPLHLPQPLVDHRLRMRRYCNPLPDRSVSLLRVSVGSGFRGVPEAEMVARMDPLTRTIVEVMLDFTRSGTATKSSAQPPTHTDPLNKRTHTNRGGLPLFLGVEGQSHTSVHGNSGRYLW